MFVVAIFFVNAESLFPEFSSVMIEGGRQVISSSLCTLKGGSPLINQMVVTIAPVLVGGPRALDRFMGVSPEGGDRLEFPRLKEVIVEKAGEDIIVMGSL